MYNTSSILLSLLTTFNRNLGIDDYYFALESVETIANHITALYGAKILAFTKNENELDINLEKESETSSVYIHSSQPGISQLEGPQCERK
jgi:glutamate dehydrogenase